jgi:hypothetical protein
MRPPSGFSWPLVLGLILSPGLSRGTWAEDTCDLRGAPRVVAVGDVHGAYDNFVKVLQMAGLVDESTRWVGGEAHLVQTGDLLDHGKDTLAVLDLLMRLEEEAPGAGGRVHALLGNHEVMNILGDLRFVDPREYETFRTPESPRRREEFLSEMVSRARAQARARGEEFQVDTYRASLEKEAPLGFVERTQALSATGRYGRWIRERKVVTKINDVVFVHGGLSPEVAALGCSVINETVHRELTRDVRETLKDPLASLTAREHGPLWYRGLSREDESAFAPSVDRVLQLMGAKAIVVAHTVTGAGRIQARFEGRVVMIDAGMAPHYGGHLAALEIGPEGRMTAIYPDRREAIERQAAESGGWMRPSSWRMRRDVWPSSSRPSPARRVEGRGR